MSDTPIAGPWKGVAAAFLAIVVGIGLSRFAYSPLIPAVVNAGWFSPSDAAYLGAANLVGYLIGALAGRRLAALTSPAVSLRGLMLLASIAFIASAYPLSFTWFFLWRLLSGITGGALMVLAAPTVLPFVAAGRRGFASGIVFTGVGLGIIVSGTLVPALLTHGLPETWFALGGLSFLATAAAWYWWPKGSAVPPARQADATATAGFLTGGLVAVFASYGFIALGLVPHMVFLVDYVARGLGKGIAVGGSYWVLFGVGALAGPLIAGRLADRFGFGPSLRAVLVFHIISAALLAFDHSTLSLVISSVVVGSAVSGTVPLVLGQTQERVSDPNRQKTAWSIATATFALGQAGGGYAYSYLYARTDGQFEHLFLLGSIALCLALAVNICAWQPVPREQSSQPAH